MPYILIDHLKKDEKLKISSNEHIQGEINIQADLVRKKKQVKFLNKECPSILKELLFKYCINEHKVPVMMRLNDTQLLSLLVSLNIDAQKEVLLKAWKKKLMLKRFQKASGLIGLL